MKYFIDSQSQTFAFEDSDAEEFIAQYAQADWLQISNLPNETPAPEFDPLTQTVTRDGCELVDGAWRYKWRIDALSAEQIAAAYAASIPQVVTMRQASIALELAGLLDDVEAIVATLPRIYQIEWQRASVVMRDNPLVEMVREQQSMTSGQIDALFVEAATL